MGSYDHVGFETRQVFNVEISVHVKEYRAEVVKNEKGVEFVADFPEGVTEPAQYGSSVKATSVYLSQFQLVPLDRVRDCFHDQFGLPLSKGTISHNNVLAYRKLESFEEWAKQQLTVSLATMPMKLESILLARDVGYIVCQQQNDSVSPR